MNLLNNFIKNKFKGIEFIIQVIKNISKDIEFTRQNYQKYVLNLIHKIIKNSIKCTKSIKQGYQKLYQMQWIYYTRLSKTHQK